MKILCTYRQLVRQCGLLQTVRKKAERLIIFVLLLLLSLSLLLLILLLVLLLLFDETGLPVDVIIVQR